MVRKKIWRNASAIAHMSAAVVAFAGCVGNIGDPAGDGRVGGTALPDAPPATGGPSGSPRFQPGPAGLRRLTRVQYANAIGDLLGEGITITSPLEADPVLSGFASIGAGLTTFSPTATETLETVALAVAKQALGDPARRARLCPCTPAATVDAACARAFVTGFGRRAWRRPLVEEEIGAYVGVAKLGAETFGDFWQGLTYALAGLLQSPHFLYRVEVGTPGRVKGQRAFDDHELATRLSFFLWNTTPDETLLAAAQAGALGKSGALVKEAERLLASPRARVALRQFFFELLRLDGLDDMRQKPATFPLATKTLGPALREETLRFVEDIVFGADGNYRRVLDDPSTFVNRELAKLYGLAAPAGTDFQRVTLPDTVPRVGLLGKASFLAQNAHETSTSPTLRGLFVREVVLCQEIPSPPPDVQTNLPEEGVDGAPRTMRERLSAHNVPGCSACHSRMDPIGLAFEHFDALGQYRTTEAGKPIDASGELDGTPFRDARELASILSKHSDIDECLTRSLYRYAFGRIETPGEEEVIKTIAARAAAAEQKFRSLIFGVVGSEGFRIAADSP